MAFNSVASEATDIVSCQLCNLPTRATVYDQTVNGSQIFCCAGCRNVWRILEESGQIDGEIDPRKTTLYQQALSIGLIGNQTQDQMPSTATQVTVERKGSGLNDQRQCILEIQGMWCSSCSWLIQQTLLRAKGVVTADVSFPSDTARVVYKPAKTDEAALVSAINQLGYSSSAMGESDDKNPRVLARRREFLRMVVCLAFAMNVMMLQLILYAGYFEGISASIRRGLPWLLFALSLPVIYCARSIFIRAQRATTAGTATMETLIALGVGSAVLYSVWQMICGTGRVYFDTSDMLLGLVMLGKFIESGVRQSASDALTLLYGLLPRKATVIADGRDRAVAISHLAKGDEIRVKEGERIAADGIVLSGAGMVDESLLSGESRPIEKCAGQNVIGGTLLKNGLLTVVIASTNQDGKLNQIINLVQDSLNKKSPAERMADQISRVFVPTVITLAICTALYLAGIEHSSLAAVMTRVVAILVIACPCALGIATPMAISAGVASAARSGILVVDGGAFETISRIKNIVLDKTGTVTDGNFEVRDVTGPTLQDRSLAALERCSGHPIAAAISSYFSHSAMDRELESVTDYCLQEGVGISGTVNGQRIFAGNERAVIAADVKLTSECADFANRVENQGRTIIYWGVCQERVLGAFALGDRLRPNAATAVRALRNDGISVDLVSGDSMAATSAIAQQIDVNSWIGEALPSEKADWIEKLVQQHANDQGTVCMVGDGVNDAPALAIADVGVALASGTDIASRTAQVTLLSPDISLLPTLISLARRTVGIVRQNLFWAFLYNIVCIPLAIAGKITPIWAACAMIISSLTVTMNTQRLKK